MSKYQMRESARLETNPEALALLAKGYDNVVRRIVARNPNTPATVLTMLAGDEDNTVRHWVACNPSAPADALAWLSGNPNCGVRSSVAANPNTPPTTLRLLSADPFNWVSLACNPSTPSDVLRHIESQTRDELPPKPVCCPENKRRVIRRLLVYNLGLPTELIADLLEEVHGYSGQFKPTGEGK